MVKEFGKNKKKMWSRRMQFISIRTHNKNGSRVFLT